MMKLIIMNDRYVQTVLVMMTVMLVVITSSGYGQDIKIDTNGDAEADN